MACNKPVKAVRDSDGVRFVGSKTLSNLSLPCGQCTGCRLERSGQWAIRCMHEGKMHPHNCFLTLTYNDANLPPGGSLRYRDYVLFMKRLLKALGSKRNQTIVGGINKPRRTRSHGATPHTPAKGFRFYMCGEYGEQYGRPHFHACIFGLDFADKLYVGKSGSGSKVYQSPTLEKLWPHGFSSIGDVTFESAAYVARYVMKKVNGQQQKKHYERIDLETGEIYQLKPEFNNMSRAQGIGKSFLEKYWTDIYPEGHVIVRGHPSKTPRYYDKQFKHRDPVAWEALEYERHQRAMKHLDDGRPSRLRVREIITNAKLSMLKRKI